MQEFSPHNLSTTQLSVINRYLDPSNVLAGIRFTALICQDTACPYKKYCPLHITQEARPLGAPCPVEIKRMAQIIQGRVHELGIKPENFTDLESVAEVARLDIMIARSEMEIADTKLVIDNAVGIDAKGHPLYVKVLNPAVQALEKFSMLKQRKLKELEATRRAKREAGEIQGRTDGMNLANMDKFLRDQKKRDAELKAKYMQNVVATVTVNEDEKPEETGSQ